MADTPPGGPPPSPIPGEPSPVPIPGEPFPPALPAKRRRGWHRALVMVGAIVFIAACAVYMLLVLGQSLGVMALLIGLVAAILPVPVLVACFLWLDRYEPEPMKYLIFCFGWGAFVATSASLNVNDWAAGLFQSAHLPVALVAVLIAPFVEESTKALGPILLWLFRRREWSGVTDGIVYCGLSAIGFAMVENILYLGGHGFAAGADQYGPATGAANVLALFIIRILFTGFAHPLFTSVTGVGLGVAARAADRRVRVLVPLAGLLIAMMLHGTWNLMPSLAAATGQNLILLYGYIGVMLPIFFAMLGLAVWLRGWEGRLTERRLPEYVRAGWLTPPEVAALGSLGRRHSARRWARRVAGDDGLRAMRGFQFSATRLALLRDGMLRGLDRKPTDHARTAVEEGRLLTEITACRRVFVGRDPQAPPAAWDGSRYEITFPDGARRTVDAPEDPVVPIPVVLAPPGAPPHGHPAPYGWPGAPGPAARTPWVPAPPLPGAVWPPPPPAGHHPGYPGPNPPWPMGPGHPPPPSSGAPPRTGQR